jgi:hypothetical protein
MPTATKTTKKKRVHAVDVKVTGRGARLITTSRPDLFLIRVGSRVTETPADQAAGPLLRKVGKALSKPGVRREAVFGTQPKKNFYAYSLDPTNPARMVREDAEGNKTVGHMVDGKFRKVAVAA